MLEVYHLMLYFFVYGFLGWCVEVAFAAYKTHKFVNRGFLNGPICPVYGFSVSLVILLLEPVADRLFLLYLSSFLLVTALEWLTGFLLEKLFHNKWWDYSDMPLNIHGYVCLLFSLMWGAACVFIVRIFHPLVVLLTGFLPVPLGIVLLVALTGIILCDVYVTSSGILKMNKRLQKMEEISIELHEISDRIGENIFEYTLAALEKQEALKESLSDAEIRERIAYLKQHYREITENVPRMQKRLLHAFPKMESKHHTNALRELREKIKDLEFPTKNS